jgi:hypothetical protein
LLRTILGEVFRNRAGVSIKILVFDTPNDFLTKIVLPVSALFEKFEAEPSQNDSKRKKDFYKHA